MATKTIPWNTGEGNITVTYTGNGNETITVNTDENPLGDSRTQTVQFQAGSLVKNLTIVQEGQGDVFVPIVTDYSYTGESVTITLDIGIYILECWGAQGGNYSSYEGGRGGYSVGTLTLESPTKVYIYVGGQPASSTSSRAVVAGGFNGGGNGQNRYYSSVYTYGQGGGGASDIRIGQDSLYARVIVAGGGGGTASENNSNKWGGGTKGGHGGASSTASYIAGQTAPSTSGYYLAGTFGKGADAYTSRINYQHGSGGGGGGWYGGYAYNYSQDNTKALKGYNGGGSGYVYTDTTASSYPSGCLLNSAYYLTDAQTIGGDTSFQSPTGTSEIGHSGNGHIRITQTSGTSGGGTVTPEDPTLSDGVYTEIGQAGVFIAFHEKGVAKYVTLNNYESYSTQSFGFITDGILVVDSEGHDIILSVEDKAKKNYKVYGTSTQESTSTEAAALKKFNGEERTAYLLTKSGCFGSNYCATYCNHYTYGGISEGNWFIPAFGELAMVADNIIEVEDALSMVGGASLITNGDDAYLYSTTDYGNSIWGVNFSSVSSILYARPSCTGHYVRPCTHFGKN